MKALLVKIFGVSRREASGLLIVYLLLLIWSHFPFERLYYSVLYKKPQLLQEYTNTETVDSTHKWLKPQPFFALNADSVQWASLPLPSQIKNRIWKYVSKGGKIKSKESLMKVYGMNDSLFTVLEPYLIFNTPKKHQERTKFALEKSTNNPVDLNSADSIELLKVKGIGPVFAGRILKYREKLGGFVDTRQLLEVYGFREESYVAVSKEVRVIGDVKKIPLDETTSFKELMKHPYIGYDQAKELFNFKKKEKRWPTFEEIKAFSSFENCSSYLSYYYPY